LAGGAIAPTTRPGIGRGIRRIYLGVQEDGDDDDDDDDDAGGGGGGGGGTASRQSRGFMTDRKDGGE